MASVVCEIRAVIRCTHCSLNQWERAACRRCRKPFREQEVTVIAIPPPSPPARLPYRFGERLAQVRRFTGKSQNEVADGMAVARPYISKVEHMRGGPIVGNISRFSKALGVPIEALVEEGEGVAFAAIAVRHMSEADRDELLAWLASRV